MGSGPALLPRLHPHIECCICHSDSRAVRWFLPRQVPTQKGGSVARKNVYFGGEALDDARRKHGLTNQQVWEELGVGETTWMRWKREGYVPIEQVTNVVLLLGLPMPKGMPDDTPRTAWVVLQKLERIETLASSTATPKARAEARALRAQADRLLGLEGDQKANLRNAPKKRQGKRS